MLYLIRHADALDAENDAARPLSPEGREQARRLAAFLARSGTVQVKEVWHSSLVRAKQTAAILAKGLALIAPIRPVDGFRPEDPAGVAAEKIEAFGNPLMIVGHNPQLTALGTLLITGSLNPEVVCFPKCAALALEPAGDGGPGSWVIRWQIDPQLLA